MMHVRPRLVALIVGLLAVGFVGVLGWPLWDGGMRSTGTSGEAATLDELVETWGAVPAIPGVILHIQKGDETLYAGAAGHLTRKNTGKIAPDTPFHTASVGKLFTSVTVLRLHEQGVLDIDKSAAHYLGSEVMQGLVDIDGVDSGDAITLRHLLSHRSGIGDPEDDLRFQLGLMLAPGKKKSPHDLLHYARRTTPAGKPGGRFSYSSPGFWLLGLVIETVTEEPFHVVVRREVFDRLGMSATLEANQEWGRTAPYLHHYFGGVDLSLFDPSLEFADGGFLTTGPDLAKFGLAMARGELFDKPDTHALYFAVPEATEDPTYYFALGPRVGLREGEPKFYLHTGHWAVWFIVFPQEEVVITATLAQSNADLMTFSKAVRRLASSELGALPKPR